ncbi:MAG: winged helix-turn-helix domain-containing protein [Kiritimatiellia bacterium]|jgi:hypothetical protein
MDVSDIRRPVGRPPAQSDKIAQILRDNVFNGSLKPGDKLPRREALARYFKCSQSALQRAIKQLRADGILTTHGNKGTIITENPPGLRRIAIAMRCFIPGQNRAYDKNIIETVRTTDFSPYSFEIYTNLDFGNAQYTELVGEIKRGMIAAIVFSSSGFWNLVGTPLEKLRPGLPRFFDNTYRTNADFPTEFKNEAHSIDSELWIDSILKKVAMGGGRRLAVVSGSLYRRFEKWRGISARHGLVIEERNFVFTPPVERIAAEHLRWLMQLLFVAENRRTFDTLVITDDNLVPLATKALRDMDCEGLDRLRIFAHSNPPFFTESFLPCIRYGIPVERTLRHVIEQVRLRRALHRLPYTFYKTQDNAME